MKILWSALLHRATIIMKRTKKQKQRSSEETVRGVSPEAERESIDSGKDL